MNEKDLKRFLSKIVSFFASDCWFWNRGLNRDGYGQFSIGYKNFRAHRISYLHYKGFIPNQLGLDHLCRNRSCVNPDHLEPTTQLVNAQRGKGAKRHYCIKGHRYNEENTYVRSGGRQSCRKCNAYRVQNRYRQQGNDNSSSISDNNNQ